MKQNIESKNYTVIGEGSDLIGDYVFQGHTLVRGHIKGSLVAVDASGASVVIAETGKVEGEVRAPEIELDGTVIGDIHCSGVIRLKSGSYLRGNLHYHTIEMASGAEINGNLIPKEK